MEYRCKLCGKSFPDTEMSEEHYPAKSVGNNDIVKVDIVEMIDTMMSGEIAMKAIENLKKGISIDDTANAFFDEELATDLYPKGRTARTLCKKCNTFLGKYDAAYLKFFSANGDPDRITGFQRKTKYQIIKAVYAKFLSIPEAINEQFDFIDFVRNESCNEYTGSWNLYFVKRNISSDLLGLKDIGTGVIEYDNGVVYELSDEKFIFNLMNFEKHACFEMTNIFTILDKHYTVINGAGNWGGYHAQILMRRLSSDMA